MSSFPEHVGNIADLKELGFDVSDLIENGEATLESWGYDELTCLLGDVIRELKRQKFKANIESLK